jgi:diguanylate cyclase (GGDEF)-like protein
VTTPLALDVPTLYVALASVATFFGLVLIVLSVLTERTRGVLVWGIAYLCIALGLVITIYRARLPLLVYGPAASTAFVVAAVLLNAGVRRPTEGLQPFYDLVVPGVALALFFFFAYAVPNLAVRLEVMLAAVAIETIRASVRLVRQAKEEDGIARTGLILFAGFFSIVSLVVTAVAIAAPFAGPIVGASAGSPLQVVLVPGLMIFLIGAGLGQLWVHYIRAFQEVQRAATTDPLTGVRNRRSIMPEYERLFQRTAREGRRLACLMLDADDFKRINDTYGHRKGDTVLVQLAQRLVGAVREYDLVGRYGGEEFLVIVPELPDADVISVARRIHDSIRSTPMNDVDVTVCIGVAFYSPEDRRPEDLIHRADLALLEAKRAGKDRIEIAAGTIGPQELA